MQFTQSTIVHHNIISEHLTLHNKHYEEEEEAINNFPYERNLKTRYFTIVTLGI